MSHLSPGAKLQAKKEFSLEDIVQASCTSPFPLQRASARLTQDSGKDLSSSTPSHWCSAFLLLSFVLQIALSNFLI